MEAAPTALQLSEQAIEVVKHNIQLCEQLVKDVLERDIDYGAIPGVLTPFLWDSGAAKIMAAFNCYARYTVIDHEVSHDGIYFAIESTLLSRQQQRIVATGLGAASTREVKHKYRWVENPEDFGYPREQLKHKKDKKYRIPNPEVEELTNTITKMAAKRADIDAVQSLPGVAATLRKLFQVKQLPLEQHSWRWFEAQLSNHGVSHEKARTYLEVKSIKDDWVGKQKKTLDEALEVIKQGLALDKAAAEVDREFEGRQPLPPDNSTQEELFPGKK